MLIHERIVLKRSWGGEIMTVSTPAAIGEYANGYRRVLDAAEGHKEDRAGLLGLLKQFQGRGLSGVPPIVSDACLGFAGGPT